MKNVHGTPEQLNIKTNKYKPVTLAYIVNDVCFHSEMQHKLNNTRCFSKENHRTSLIQEVMGRQQITRHKTLACCNPVRHHCANCKCETQSKLVVEKN